MYFINELSFKTGVLAEVTTNEPSEITANSATCGGNIGSIGDSEITEQGVCYSLFENPTIDSSKVTAALGSTDFTCSISGLELNTAYYVRAYAKNSSGVAYGSQKNFKTKNGVPEIILDSMNNVTAISANIFATIINDGGLAITSKGFCWGAISQPTIDDNTIENSSANQNMNNTLTGLDPANDYYVRGYITNELGTFYSNNQYSFTTETGLPIISTLNVDSIERYSVYCKGEVLSDEGYNITSRGFCWNSTGLPTISDNTIVVEGEVGPFSSIINGLNPKTTYFLRSFATNQIGTAYGEVVSFTTLRIDEGYFIDNRDNEKYRYVTIGSQVWMAENLRATTYNDGSEIPYVTNNSSWVDLLDSNYDDAYCYYDNNVNSVYGALYTYAAAINVCPLGWHLPSDEEWNTLEIFINNEGFGGNEGYALKAINYWDEGYEGNDFYGFTGLPGGSRFLTNGYFTGEGINGNWWSSTEHEDGRVYRRILSTETIGRTAYYKSSGFSVRCIKD